jgi:hypothetical protein
MQLSQYVSKKLLAKRTSLTGSLLSASILSVSLLTPAITQAEVVELTPNELNSAYIKDSTIYIPKATREKVAKKIVNVKVRPGEPNPDQIDRDAELKEGAAQTVISGLEANQSWDSTRTENSLALSTQPAISTEDLLLPPREIPGAPDGFELEPNVDYTLRHLIDSGFVNPQTNQPLTTIPSSGLDLNSLAVSFDETTGTIQIPLPPDFESRLPPGGINTDILSINPAQNNAINIRLQLPQN